MAVYCGASLGNEPIYQQAAVALAAWMKENHYDQFMAVAMLV